MPATLDLATYGVPHILRAGFNFNVIKQSDLRKGTRAISVSSGETKSFTLGDGAGVKYTVEENLGEGTYGIAYRAKAPDGKEYAIKFIKEKLSDKTEFITFLKECIVQILVVEASKTKADGPYAPRVYDICYNSTRNEGYIRSELMKNKLDNLVGAFTPDQNDVFLPDALQQIAKMISDLQKSLEFSHRDMKGDNIMYTKGPGGRRLMRLIDFGMACVTWNGMKISGSSWFDASHSCFKKDRDMSQLIFYIQRYHHTKLSPQLDLRFQLMLRASVGASHKCDMHKLCPTHGLKEWRNVYNFVDRANVKIPGGKPNFVAQDMQRFSDGEAFESPVNSLVVSLTPSPEAAALPARDPPGICPPGEHKDPATGRCVKDIAPPLVGNAGLAPCPAGKVRNPATGRCVKATGAVARHVAAAPAALSARAVAPKPHAAPAGAVARAAAVHGAVGKPCPPGKIRHPRTRRCVKAGVMGGTRKHRY
jgi:hypothetical protein